MALKIFGQNKLLLSIVKVLGNENSKNNIYVVQCNL